MIALEDIRKRPTADVIVVAYGLGNFRIGIALVLVHKIL